MTRYYCGELPFYRWFGVDKEDLPFEHIEEIFTTTGTEWKEIDKANFNIVIQDSQTLLIIADSEWTNKNDYIKVYNEDNGDTLYYHFFNIERVINMDGKIIYQITFTLDTWFTYEIYMYKNCIEGNSMTYAWNGHADRFLVDTEGLRYIDYVKQPYLTSPNTSLVVKTQITEDVAMSDEPNSSIVPITLLDNWIQGQATNYPLSSTDFYDQALVTETAEPYILNLKKPWNLLRGEATSKLEFIDTPYEAVMYWDQYDGSDLSTSANGAIQYVSYVDWANMTWDEFDKIFLSSDEKTYKYMIVQVKPTSYLSRQVLGKNVTDINLYNQISSQYVSNGSVADLSIGDQYYMLVPVFNKVITTWECSDIVGEQSYIPPVYILQTYYINKVEKNVDLETILNRQLTTNWTNYGDVVGTIRTTYKPSQMAKLLTNANSDTYNGWLNQTIINGELVPSISKFMPDIVSYDATAGSTYANALAWYKNEANKSAGREYLFFLLQKGSSGIDVLSKLEDTEITYFKNTKQMLLNINDAVVRTVAENDPIIHQPLYENIQMPFQKSGAGTLTSDMLDFTTLYGKPKWYESDPSSPYYDPDHPTWRGWHLNPATKTGTISVLQGSAELDYPTFRWDIESCRNTSFLFSPCREELVWSDNRTYSTDSGYTAYVSSKYTSAGAAYESASKSGTIQQGANSLLGAGLTFVDPTAYMKGTTGMIKAGVKGLTKLTSAATQMSAGESNVRTIDSQRAAMLDPVSGGNIPPFCYDILPENVDVKYLTSTLTQGSIDAIHMYYTAYGYILNRGQRFEDYENRIHFNYIKMDSYINKPNLVEDALSNKAEIVPELFAKYEYVETFLKRLWDGIRVHHCLETRFNDVHELGKPWRMDDEFNLENSIYDVEDEIIGDDAWEVQWSYSTKAINLVVAGDAITSIQVNTPPNVLNVVYSIPLSDGNTFRFYGSVSARRFEMVIGALSYEIAYVNVNDTLTYDTYWTQGDYSWAYNTHILTMGTNAKIANSNNFVDNCCTVTYVSAGTLD